MKRTLINYLGLLGMVSLLSYTAAVIFSPLAYPDYHWLSQAVSDLSEDIRKELDNIYQAIAALSVKVPQARKPANPIGFKRSEKGK